MLGKFIVEPIMKTAFRKGLPEKALQGFAKGVKAREPEAMHQVNSIFQGYFKTLKDEVPNMTKQLEQYLKGVGTDGIQ